MIYGLREYIVSKVITRLKEMLTGFTPAVQVVGQYSQVKLAYPNVYVAARLPSFSSSVLGDFWGDEKQFDGTWQERYAVRIPNVGVTLSVTAKNEIERAKVTDKIVSALVLGKNASDQWWKDLLYSDGLQLKTVSLAAESEEDTPQEGKVFKSQVVVNIDTEFNASITDNAITLITITDEIVVTL